MESKGKMTAVTASGTARRLILIVLICFILYRTPLCAGRKVGSVSSSSKGSNKPAFPASVIVGQDFKGKESKLEAPLRLCLKDNELILARIDDSTPAVALSISSGGNISITALPFNDKDAILQAKTSKANDRSEKQLLPVYAVFGFYEMPMGTYMLLVTDVQPVLNIPIAGVVQATRFKLIKIPHSSSNSDGGDKASSAKWSIQTLQQQRAMESLLLDTVKKHQFYYSVGKYDILRTYQENKRRNSSVEASTIEARDLWNRDGNDRFFWNQNRVLPLISAGCDHLVVKICSAWIGSFSFTVQDVPFSFTLISRRSKVRQGPRYIKRGIDQSGEVANFVEVEQILHRKDGKANSSFVQVLQSVVRLRTHLPH